MAHEYRQAYRKTVSKSAQRQWYITRRLHSQHYVLDLGERAEITKGKGEKGT